jgi:hypothetical protein
MMVAAVRRVLQSLLLLGLLPASSIEMLVTAVVPLGRKVKSGTPIAEKMCPNDLSLLLLLLPVLLLHACSARSGGSASKTHLCRAAAHMPPPLLLLLLALFITTSIDDIGLANEPAAVGDAKSTRGCCAAATAAPAASMIAAPLLPMPLLSLLLPSRATARSRALEVLIIVVLFVSQQLNGEHTPTQIKKWGVRDHKVVRRLAMK